MIIDTSKCETCKNGSVEIIDKGHIYVSCLLKDNSRWFYGQYAECPNKHEKKETEE